MIAIELEAHADPALPVHAVSSPMKVVGLLSGGKDSCFNLCHCVKQGHEVIALASLRPEGGKGGLLQPVTVVAEFSACSLGRMLFREMCNEQRKSIRISIRQSGKTVYISLLKLSSCPSIEALSMVLL